MPTATEAILPPRPADFRARAVVEDGLLAGALVRHFERDAAPARFPSRGGLLDVDFALHVIVVAVAASAVQDLACLQYLCDSTVPQLTFRCAGAVSDTRPRIRGSSSLLALCVLSCAAFYSVRVSKPVISRKLIRHSALRPRAKRSRSSAIRRA
jgi:hypothetical protein